MFPFFVPVTLFVSQTQIFIIMAIDIFKQNLTEPEAQQLLDQETRGKIFEDGIYQYRIFASFNSNVGLGSSVGLIITIMNIPDVIGPDLIKYVLTRISVILRNFKNKDLKFLVHKIWIDDYGHDINFEKLINKRSELRFFYLNLIKDVDSVYSTYDFKAQNDRFAKKTKKLETLIDHFNKEYKRYEYDIDRFIHSAGLPAAISKQLKKLKVDDVILHCEAEVKSRVHMTAPNQVPPGSGPGEMIMVITYSVNVNIQENAISTKESESLYTLLKSLPSKTIVDHLLIPVAREVKNYIFSHTMVELESVVVQAEYANGSSSTTYRGYD